jgi:hypothetical protein
MLHPRQATPEAIGEWLSRPAQDRSLALERIDFRGLDRLPSLLDDVLNGSAGGEAHPATGSS